MYTGLQATSRLHEPGDIFEREADRMADQVMAIPTRSAVSGTPLPVRRTRETRMATRTPRPRA
jgi:hypothetical protein